MSKRILLVEDNATDEKLALVAFKQSGVAGDIVVARDGASALDMLHAVDAELPAVVLLDLKMPKIGGLEVLRRLRSDPRTKALAVVILTASKEEEDIAQSYALGANAYVRKPVEFSEFLQTAKTVGQFWLHLNEPAPTSRGAP